MIRLFVLVEPTVNAFKQKVFWHLLGHPDVQVVGACINDRRALSPMAKAKRELRRGRGGYVLVQILQRLFGRNSDRSVSAQTFFDQHRVPTFRTDNLYNPLTLAAIREYEPDVIFRAGFGIIKEPVLSLGRWGVLSYHHGDLRKYRGQPVAFWELYHGESEMRVVVQRLSATLDGGCIVKEQVVPILPDDTWTRLNDRVYAASDKLALQAVLDLNEGIVPAAVTEGLGPLYTTPNLRQWLTLQMRVLGRQVRHWLGGDSPEKDQALIAPARSEGDRSV